ncbi:major facilitator transporter [Psychromonas sp. PRT-SC03]|nr:major facilitator transporter [Psychromonas sp. PRT-SC03]
MSKLLCLVILMAAVGQMTQTMYVPSISVMSDYFSVPASSMQAVMAAYLIPYGISQFIYGPLSDRVGRRPVILIGLVIFMLGSVLTLMTSNFTWFLVGSFIQGLGTGSCGAMARTITRDCFDGPLLHKANSYVSMGIIFSPLIAPLLGGFLTQVFNWHMTYVFLLVIGVLVTAIMYFFFFETLPKERRKPEKTLSSYKVVLSNKHFQGYLFTLLFTFAGVAVYEAALGVLLGGVLKLDSATISVLFILPLPGYFIGSALSSLLVKKMSVNTVLYVSVFALLLGALCIVIPGTAGQVMVNSLVIGGFIYFLGAGILFPAATSAALMPFPYHAGTAGALLGGTQNLAAGLAAMSASFMSMDDQFNLGGTMLLLAVLTLIFLRQSTKSHHYNTPQIS